MSKYVKPGPNWHTFHPATAMTRCMTQAAPHHLPHDLSVQGGEMYHVQIKDQVDGIVLDGCSGMVKILVPGPGEHM